MEGDDVKAVDKAAGGRQLCFYRDPSLTFAGSMRYRGIHIFLYKKNDWIYYEPIAVLDPKSISIERLSANKFILNFDLEMWNANLKDEVANYLRDDPEFKELKYAKVQAMPYEEVRLVNIDISGGGFQLPSQPTWYLQLDERLNFRVMCDAKDIAGLVMDINRLTLAKKLTKLFSIECKSPATGRADGTFYHGALGVKCLNRFSLKLITETACVIETPINTSKLEAASNGNAS